MTNMLMNGGFCHLCVSREELLRRMEVVGTCSNITPFRHYYWVQFIQVSRQHFQQKDRSNSIDDSPPAVGRQQVAVPIIYTSPEIIKHDQTYFNAGY